MIPGKLTSRRTGWAAAAMFASLSICGPAGATDFGPTDFPLTILGVHVEIPVTASYVSKSQGTDLVITASVAANLKNVQAQALDIARAMKVPKENCAHQGINPVVNSIDAASIVSSGTDAVISISGRVTAWACQRVSGFTLKTVLPPKKVAMTFAVPLRAQVFDHTRIGVALAGPVSVTGPGLNGDILSLLSAYFQDEISKQLTKALDADAARAKFPALPGLTVELASAGFEASGADLVIRSSGTASLSSDSFRSLLSHLGP